MEEMMGKHTTWKTSLYLITFLVNHHLWPATYMDTFNKQLHEHALAKVISLLPGIVN